MRERSEVPIEWPTARLRSYGVLGSHSAYDLLAHDPGVWREDLAAELSGVICRCTGYRNIVEAVADSYRSGEEGSPSLPPRSAAPRGSCQARFRHPFHPERSSPTPARPPLAAVLAKRLRTALADAFGRRSEDTR